MSSPAMPTSFTPLTANLLCMVSMFVWSMGLPAADLLMGPIPPLPLTAIRMSLAALVLLPLWLFVDGWSALRGANWRGGIIVGGIGFGLGAYFLIVAQGYTDAVTVAVIAATMPVVAIALECLFDDRKLTFALIVGVLLSLSGGLLAYISGIGEMRLGLGALAAFASVVTFAWASRATVKTFPTLSPIGRTAITLTGAGLVTTIAALAMQASGAAAPDWAAIGSREVAALIFYAIAAMALSQVLWILAVGNLGIGLASMHLNATPFYVMILLFVLGGGWNWTQALGAGIVGAGVLIAQTRRSV